MRFGAVVIFFFAVTAVSSQQCLPFDPLLAPASGEVCFPYLSSLVWLPLVPNAISMIDDAFNTTIFWKMNVVKPMYPFSCIDTVMSLLCNAAFPPCNYSEGFFNIALAYPMCRSVCEYTNLVCSDIFTFYEQAPFNCSMTDIVTGEGGQWPEEYRVNTFLGINIDTPCTTALPTTEPNYSQIICPPPAAKVVNPDVNTPPCDVPCPDPTWTIQEWKTIALVLFSCGLISVISLGFLIIHYLADPRCRNSVKRFQLYSFVTLFLFCLGFLIGGPDPINSVWCETATIYATSYRPRCGAQALLFIVFGLSSAIWWAISSLILYQRLVHRKYRISKEREIFCHVAAIGLPLIPFIVGVKEGAIEFLFLTPFCFAQTNIKGSSLNYQFVLFYIPLAFPMTVAIAFILCTVYKIIKHSNQLKKSFTKDQMACGKSLMKINVRLLVWCLVLFLEFFTLTIYRSVVAAEDSTLTSSAYSWGKCRVIAELGLGTFDKCPDSAYPHPISFPGTIVHYIIVSSIGTFTFLAFGTSDTVYRFWYYIIRLVWRREWTNLYYLVMEDKALSHEKQKAKKEVQMKGMQSGKLESSDMSARSNDVMVNEM